MIDLDLNLYLDMCKTFNKCKIKNKNKLLIRLAKRLNIILLVD